MQYNFWSLQKICQLEKSSAFIYLAKTRVNKWYVLFESLQFDSSLISIGLTHERAQIIVYFSPLGLADL